MKPYVVKDESNRQVLGKHLDFVEDFWCFSKLNQVFLQCLVIENQWSQKKDIFRETGLSIRGQKLGHWFENRNFFVKQIGWSGQKGNMTSFCLRLAYFCGLVCLYSRWFCGQRNLEECMIWSCNTFWEELYFF